MPRLSTERLLLVPFGLELIQAAIEDRIQLERQLNARVHDEWPNPDFEEILPFLAQKMTQDPAEADWICLVVHSLDRIVIGEVGFKGKPNLEGIVEIGYGIVPSYQGQGFATEATNALVRWALSQPGVRRVTAECLSSNAPSIRVLEKIGMRCSGVEGEMLRWETNSDGVRRSICHPGSATRATPNQRFQRPPK